MWIVGDFVTNNIDFGSGPIVNGGNNSIFAIKLDPSGALLTAVDFFESNNFQRANDVTTDADNNVWIAGAAAGTINFGGGNHVSANTGRTDVFVVKLNTFGVWQESGMWGNGVLDVSAVRIALSPGGVVVGGELRGSVDFGGGALAGTGGTNADVFVTSFDANAGHLWSKSFGGGGGYKDLRALAVDAAGNIAVGGRFETSLDFGGGALASAGGNEDMFLAKLDPSGAHVFSRRYGDAADDGTVKGLGFDANGNLIAGVDYEGSIDFGDGPHDNPSASDDIAVFKLSADGTFLWAHSYGDTASQMISGIAVHQPSGNITIAGNMAGEINLGSQTLVANGTDPYVFCAGP
jgi:hypothetical protein